jgi:hypothetical protein
VKKHLKVCSSEVVLLFPKKGGDKHKVGNEVMIITGKYLVKMKKKPAS